MKYYKHSENITLMTSMYQSQGLNKCLHLAQTGHFYCQIHKNEMTLA